MAFYALGTKPLQDILKEISPVTKQVWLADDATGAASLTNLKMWWDTIILEGPKFGYHVNESKSWLIIKDNNKLDYAKEMFYDTSIHRSHNYVMVKCIIGTVVKRCQRSASKFWKTSFCEIIKKLLYLLRRLK